MNVEIFIINLPSSTDRKSFMEDQLRNLGLTARWVDAVDGRLLSDDEFYKVYDERLAKMLIGRTMARREVGCYLSHLKVLRDLVASDSDGAIVFEDDVTIFPVFKKFLSQLDKLPKDLDLVTFANYPDSSRVFGNIELGEFTLKTHVNGIWGTYAYFITKSGASKILADSERICMPVDFVGRVWGSDKLSIRVVHPYCVHTGVDQFDQCKTFPSLIGPDRRLVETQSFKPKPIDVIKTIIRRIITWP